MPTGGANDTATLQLVLRVDNAAVAGDSVNYAEISADDGVDIDSTPDTTNADPGGQPGSPADDFVNGNGTGTVGDGVAATDEDDHDPAQVTIEVYDLALRKQYTSDDHMNPTDGVVTRGSLVTFTITVINQGSVDADAVTITDYLPSGFSFPAGNATNTANGWSLVGGNPTTTLPATLDAAGGANDTVQIPLVLQVTNTAAAGTSVNYAEISGDDGVDVDSVPDTTNSDPGGQPGSPADDHVDGDGTGVPGDGVPATDEDDHDPAEVTVEIYDLALRKVYTSDDHNGANDGIVQPGSLVTFTVTVINQGTVAASNVQVTDYVPSGFTFPAANATNTANGWTAAGSNAVTTIPGACRFRSGR